MGRLPSILAHLLFLPRAARLIHRARLRCFLPRRTHSAFSGRGSHWTAPFLSAADRSALWSSGPRVSAFAYIATEDENSAAMTGNVAQLCSPPLTRNWEDKWEASRGGIRHGSSAVDLDLRRRWEQEGSSHSFIKPLGGSRICASGETTPGEPVIPRRA